MSGVPSTWVGALKWGTGMSRIEEDLSDLLGPEPVDPNAEVLVDEAPKKKSDPMGKASRALLERSRSYDVRRAVPKKNSPERLSRLLNAISENGVANSACLRAGLSMTTLKFWLQKSSEGRPGDGFDIQLGINDESETGDTVRFHDAWDLAMKSGVEAVEAAVMKRAVGYREVLTYQGRVIYQQNPVLVALGYTGMEAYLLDEFGAPVPETVEKMDPDLAMFILTHRKPEVYGKKASLDVNVRGGVLVVGVKVEAPEDLNLIEEEYRRVGTLPVTFDDSDEDE